MFNDVATTPVELLLWFHHLPWTHPMPRPANYTPGAGAAGADGGGTVCPSSPPIGH